MAEKYLDIQGKKVRIKQINGYEMLNLTDVANLQTDKRNALDRISNWFNKHYTLDYLEAYEEEFNPNFQKKEMKSFIKKAKEDINPTSLKDFKTATNSPFLIVSSNGEIWAVFDIIMDFMMTFSSNLMVWFIRDYRKMKSLEKETKYKNEFGSRTNKDLMEYLEQEQKRLDDLKNDE